MTTITILPEEKIYRAVGKNKESVGRTAGEALDALTAQFGEEDDGTLIIVQNRRADKFFDSAQQERLTELMEKRENRILKSEEQSELENLVESELHGARLRAEELLGGLKP